MHEIAICQRIIDEAGNLGVSKSIVVEVGELGEIGSEEVEETLKKMVDWDVRVEGVDSKVKCSCGYSGRARIVERGHGFCIFNCPECSGKVEVLGGGGIRIVGFE